MIDSHAHLDDPAFDSDRDEVLNRARDSGLAAVVTIGCDLETSRAAVELADRHDFIYATVGIHPHEAKSAGDGVYEELTRLARHPKVVAWGETGLDYHYMNSPRETQLRVFRDQIRIAKGLGLPLVVHTREAASDTLKLLSEEEAAATAGVFHCFSEELSTARAALEMNFMLSISGIVTFAKADRLQEVVRQIPSDRLLIETDCPYLTPVPHRGRRNEPSYVRYVADKVAQLSPPGTNEEIGRITAQNARRLFRLPL